MLATVTGWSTQEKAAYLDVSLKGAAVNVLNGIPADRLYDYNTHLTALEAHFGSGHQAELNRMKLKNRVRKREEGLTELAEDVEKLIRLAYPDADPAMMELLGIVLDHFIDALHEEEDEAENETESPKNFDRSSSNHTGVGILPTGKQTEVQTSEGSQDRPQL